ALCEAQIAAKLHTPWDDLPLPPVDDARKERLLEGMPDPRSGRMGRANWIWPATIVASVAMIAGAVGFVFLRDPKPVVVHDTDAVERIVQQAHVAAAQAFYVYPPVENPTHDTAYTN